MRLNRCQDLDTLVSVALAGLAELLGYEHTLLLLLDEDGKRLYTIASHGYDAQGVGSEVAMGEGLIGMAASRCVPMRVGSMRQMLKYSTSVRRTFEEHGIIGPGHEIPIPGLAERGEPHRRARDGARSAGRRVGRGEPGVGAVRRHRRGDPQRRRRGGRQRHRDRRGAGTRRDRVGARSRGAGAEARGDRGRDTRAVLRCRRERVPRRRLPDQGGRGPHPVGAARPLRA